jgi:hypothetical protein
MIFPAEACCGGGTGAPPSCGGGGLEDEKDGSELKKLELPEQPPSSTPAVPSKPASERRRVSIATGAWSGISPGKMGLLTTDIAD